MARILKSKTETPVERRRFEPVKRARRLHPAAFPGAQWCVPWRMARWNASSRFRVVIERGRVMDRCSRWFYSGDALAYEIPASSDPPINDGVGPRAPRFWETCPVCGQLVAPHPEWIAQIVYEDGIALFFDGAKDLFRFLLSPRRSASDSELIPIAGVYVTSFFDGEVIDARESFFVVGSDVLGPGGDELVAHRSVADARKFSRQHNGRRVFGFKTLNSEVLGSTLGGET